ncbi:MAG: phage baseplate assembly protein V, partial [Trebonia sp.]
VMLTEADAIGPYSRQVSAPFRVGIVSAQQLSPFPAVRVQFPDRDNVVSGWLPPVVRCSQDDKDFWLPDIGEQVVCLMDEHDENGAVLGAIYSEADTAKSWAAAGVRGFQASDGAIVTYNRNNHTLTAQLPTGATATISTGQGSKMVLGSDGTALVRDAAGAYVKATNDGNVHVNGNLLVAGTISTTAGTWGDGHGTITGSLTATGELTAKYGTGSVVNLSTHDTSAVQSGGGTSGPPVPNT